MTSIKKFHEDSAKIKTKEEAVIFIAKFISNVATPTFGMQDADGYFIDPYNVWDDEEYTEKEDECISVYREALTLVDELAKKFGVPFDSTLFESIMRNMRSHRDGVWKSSSLNC